MICPNCKNEINKVAVVSECMQWVYLKLNSNEIDSTTYGQPDIDETKSIHCLYCGFDLIKYVEE